MDNIAVIGAGTMGNGIAHVFAQYGYSVQLIDLSPTQLEKAILTISKNLDRQIQKGFIPAENKSKILGHIHPISDIKTGVKEASLIVEAATEKETIKTEIFREMDLYAPAEAILATNTSSISITRIASATKRPQQVIGMHFMNPVPLMKLVEVINGYATLPSVTEKIIKISEQLGKVPCLVNDYPGFVSNRILMPMINEAIISLQESVASVTAIDTVMKLGMAHPMGPLQLADFIGLDVCLSIMKVLQEETGNPKYAPATLLINMVAADKLGVKTGEGFYLYHSNTKDLIVSEKFR